MTKKIQQIIGVAAAIAMLGGCLQISGEVEELTKVVRDDALIFDGAGSLAGRPVEETRSFTLDLENDLIKFVVFAGVREVTFVPREGVDDFEFVNSVTARLVGAQAEGLADVVIAEYVKDPKAIAEGKLVMKINPDVDISEYIQRGATCAVDLDFDAKPFQWSVDMELSLTLDLGVSM